MSNPHIHHHKKRDLLKDNINIIANSRISSKNIVLMDRPEVQPSTYSRVIADPNTKILDVIFYNNILLIDKSNPLDRHR